MPCPKGVDIPGTFASYNLMYSENWYAGMKAHIMTTALRNVSTGAGNCVKCGKCEQHCPQQIPIRDMLDKARRKMEGPIYKAARFGIKFILDIHIQ